MVATKSTELATMLTATSCRVQVVADLSPKPATKSTVSATVDFVADLSPVSQQSTLSPECTGLQIARWQHLTVGRGASAVSFTTC